jgi:type III pantothenate kinase
MTNRLLLDVGNSRLKAGWQTPTDCHTWQAEQLHKLLQKVPDHPDEIWLSAVTNTTHQHALLTALTEGYSRPIQQVSVAQYQHHLPTLYAPTQLGVDRWLAMLACKKTRPGPCLVIDCGTAATFDCINANGIHTGGYILPGIHLMHKILLQNTAIPVTHSSDNSAYLAQDTATAITQGSCRALASLIIQMHSEMPDNTHLYIGGGDGQALLPHLTMPYTRMDNMVINGLACLADLEA